MHSFQIMKEHRLTIVTRVLIWLLIVSLGIGAAYNVINGTATRPGAFYIVLVGFILFATGKLSVILRKRKVSFGTKLMTQGMANLYRFGYWLMVVGLLATFAP